MHIVSTFSTLDQVTQLSVNNVNAASAILIYVINLPVRIISVFIHITAN